MANLINRRNKKNKMSLPHYDFKWTYIQHPTTVSDTISLTQNATAWTDTSNIAHDNYGWYIINPHQVNH